MRINCELLVSGRGVLDFCCSSTFGEALDPACIMTSSCGAEELDNFQRIRAGESFSCWEIQKVSAIFRYIKGCIYTINGIFYKCKQPNKMSIANCIFQISKWYRPASGDKLRVSMSMCSYPPGRAAQETLEKKNVQRPYCAQANVVFKQPPCTRLWYLKKWNWTATLHSFCHLVPCFVLCHAIRSIRAPPDFWAGDRWQRWQQMQIFDEEIVWHW